MTILLKGFLSLTLYYRVFREREGGKKICSKEMGEKDVLYILFPLERDGRKGRFINLISPF